MKTKILLTLKRDKVIKEIAQYLRKVIEESNKELSEGKVKFHKGSAAFLKALKS